MSDLNETEYFSEQTWCPDCGGPPINEKAMIQYCMRHAPPTRGTQDPTNELPSGMMGNEAGGEDNVAFCRLIHRGKRKTR